MVSTLSPPSGVVADLVMPRSARWVVARALPPVQSLLVTGSRLMPPPVSGSSEPPLPPVQAVLVRVAPAARASVFNTRLRVLPPVTGTG